MKVCKCALVVIKWKLINDLYNLQCSTIINSVSVAFVVDWFGQQYFYSDMAHAANTWKGKIVGLSRWDLCG